MATELAEPQLSQLIEEQKAKILKLELELQAIKIAAEQLQNIITSNGIAQDCH